jgi:hypothetical protein
MSTSTFNIADTLPSRDLPRKIPGFYGYEDNLSLSLQYLLFFYIPILSRDAFDLYTIDRHQ